MLCVFCIGVGGDCRGRDHPALDKVDNDFLGGETTVYISSLRSNPPHKLGPLAGKPRTTVGVAELAGSQAHALHSFGCRGMVAENAEGGSGGPRRS